MSPKRIRVDVAVVGGGPVGIFLAAELGRRGIDCVVLERRVAPLRHSRSIGIHPPALAALAGAGATDAILGRAVLVRRGLAYARSERLGALSFDGLHPRHPYVATLPQDETEAILEEALRRVAPGSLRRGRHVQTVTLHRDGVVLRGVSRDAEGGRERAFEVRARAVVGCDGRDSVVRAQAGLEWRRASYPDTYVMGDVDDATDLGAAAAIYLERDGVVESFPLPRGRRRWVIKTSRRMPDPGPEELARLLAERVAVHVDPASCSMTSSFGIERGAAERFVRGRVLLAGDSAHVVPPIGGQGMNLGWLDAYDIAGWLPDALASASPDAWAAAARAYDDRRRRAFRTAARRADLNVRLGRATRWSSARNWLIRGLLSPPVAPVMARMFTMHGLGSGAPSPHPPPRPHAA